MSRRKLCSQNITRPARLVLAASTLFVLGACTGEGDQTTQFGQTGFIAGFYGGVAVDEPNAALVGRDVLTAGGTAADAATAIGFALSVSYPSAITLGGGGTCLVHDATLGVTEALDFISPAGSGPEGDRATAVPGLSRGLVALHARYGRLDWRRLVAPAEQMARLGHRASRAFTTELAPAAGAIFRDRDLRGIFSGPGGQPLKEGERFQQVELAGTLGRIRAQGGGAPYTGTLADRVVEGYREAGGSLTRDDLRDFVPQWKATILIPFGDLEMHFPPPPAQAGIVEAQVWDMLSTDDRYADAREGERPHLLVEASKRALGDRRRWLDGDFFAAPDATQLTSREHVAQLFAGYSEIDASSVPSAPQGVGDDDLAEAPAGTGFVVVDREGMAVACTLTNYYPFGTGRMAQGTGIIPAAAPTGRGRNTLSLGPAIAATRTNFAFRFAIATSGGAFAQATLSQIAGDILLRNQSPREAIARPRVLGVDRPHIAVVETGGNAEAEALRLSGHTVQQTAWPGRAAVASCPRGLPVGDDEVPVCAIQHDPRGFGLSTVAPTGGE